MLFAVTPRGPVRALGTWLDRVARLIDSSTIEPGRRGPSDPTHRLDLSTPHDDEYTVRLSLRFVAGHVETAHPGIWIEVTMTPVILGPTPTSQGASVRAHFSTLVETFGADFGHVEVPGQPVGTVPSLTPRAGWLTYLPRPVEEVKAALPDRTVWPCGPGSLVVASEEPAADNLDAIRALL
jgi:hypothetical protein